MRRRCGHGGAPLDVACGGGRVTAGGGPRGVRGAGAGRSPRGDRPCGGQDWVKAR
ncbi:hypothetical protein FM106_02280 [Brachybacterium faecium]|nr:hypothetical protein FM106_02280 [Brachybacterium faecium]